jgi:hypothetical protein
MVSFPFVKPRDRKLSIARGAWAGALAGTMASWVMDRVQGPILSAGSEEAKARERAAAGDEEPATVRVAAALARAAGRPLQGERERRLGGQVVHYATGAAFGSLFAVLVPRGRAPALLAGAAFGALVWLVNDETIVPLLGFAKGPRAYPPSTHAKALAAHLVYGVTTGTSLGALERVLG